MPVQYRFCIGQRGQYGLVTGVGHGQRRKTDFLAIHGLYPDTHDTCNDLGAKAYAQQGSTAFDLAPDQALLYGKKGIGVDIIGGEWPPEDNQQVRCHPFKLIQVIHSHIPVMRVVTMSSQYGGQQAKVFEMDVPNNMCSLHVD